MVVISGLPGRDVYAAQEHLQEAVGLQHVSPHGLNVPLPVRTLQPSSALYSRCLREHLPQPAC
jgi:hypothetical protein